MGMTFPQLLNGNLPRIQSALCAALLAPDGDEITCWCEDRRQM